MKAPQDFKVGQVWNDGFRMANYFIKKICPSHIEIQWLDSSTVEFVRKSNYKEAFSEEDVYVRELTSLEKELM